MSYRIPIGPYHPALEEPYKLDLLCEGETVQDASLTVGFNFRGIEYLAERRNFIQVIALVERVCGICSNVHTLTYCQAVERLAGIHVSERAAYIRVVVAELERLHSHILWAGIAAELVGYQTVFMTCFALREMVMDLLEAISGNRVNYAMNCIGGVNRDLTDPAGLFAKINDLETRLTGTLIPLFTSDRMVRSRCAGVGVLSAEEALRWGVVGPTARASGLGQDIRKADPYAAYAMLDFDIPVLHDGDVMARLTVRALEMIESCKIIRQALDKLPGGPIRGPAFVDVPSGEVLSRIEGPRGEVFYAVASNGGDCPARVRVRTPSFANMPAVRLMLRGASLADAALIQASIDPCYSCTDR
jgi:Ni,Fe-hydrogenase III large subunit